MGWGYNKLYCLSHGVFDGISWDVSLRWSMGMKAIEGRPPNATSIIWDPHGGFEMGLSPKWKVYFMHNPFNKNGWWTGVYLHFRKPSHPGWVVWLPFFIFPWIIIPIDFHIFQRGGPTTNQHQYWSHFSAATDTSAPPGPRRMGASQWCHWVPRLIRSWGFFGWA